ncbi:MAG: NUDIX domain-containing protein [Armatimonadota bacterium]|nr:NUDIX domain-containing protein [Armatimonadota bacterium]
MPPSISDSLISWYRDHRRDLPWRKTSDPYEILVSEIMLQQTRSATVVPYFEKFIAQFPSAKHLADATDDDALAAWQGLGYYRRLRNLKAAAKEITENGWSQDLESLPGVGRYTGRAVGSIAFGKQEACADGNVRRVMSRICGRDLSLTQAEEASTVYMESRRAAEWNQAVMELGATVCTPVTPACAGCPARHGCIAFREASVALYPSPALRKQTVDLTQVCVCPVLDHKVGVRRGKPDEWWAGMYCFARTTLAAKESPTSAAKRLGLANPQKLGSLRHVVTHHRVKLESFVGDGCRESTYEWMSVDSLRLLPMPSPDRKVAGWLEKLF